MALTVNVKMDFMNYRVNWTVEYVKNHVEPVVTLSINVTLVCKEKTRIMKLVSVILGIILTLKTLYVYNVLKAVNIVVTKILV